MSNELKRRSAAIAECLEECLDAESPLASLAAYLNNLRENGWSYEDRHTVEMTVQRLFEGIVATSDVAGYEPIENISEVNHQGEMYLLLKMQRGERPGSVDAIR